VQKDRLEAVLKGNEDLDEEEQYNIKEEIESLDLEIQAV